MKCKRFVNQKAIDCSICAFRSLPICAIERVDLKEFEVKVKKLLKDKEIK